MQPSFTIPLYESNTHWVPIPHVACIISAASPEKPGALCLFIFFNAATISPILMQSSGPSLTSADIPWSYSFSSIISFSMYSFHESLIPFSSTSTLPDTPFRQFDPVISCLSFTIRIAIWKISFWCSGSFKSLAYSFCFCFSSFTKEITLFALCLLFLYSFHASVEFSLFHF